MIRTSLQWLALVALFCRATAQQVKCPDAKEVTANGKVYTVKCDTVIAAAGMAPTPGQSLEDCAAQCSKQSDCKGVVFNANKNQCLIKTGDTSNHVSNKGFHAMIYKGPAPPSSPPPATGGNEKPNQNQQPIGGNSGSDKPDSGTGKGTDDNNGAGTSTDAGTNGLGKSHGTCKVYGPNQNSYNCPQDNGKTYMTGGITYEYLCNTGHNGGQHGPIIKGLSMTECADRCAKDPQCYSLDYLNGDCMQKTKTTTVPWSGAAFRSCGCPVRSTSLKVKPEITTNSACPQNNDKIIKGTDGTWFYVQCCTDASGASILETVTATSQDNCMEKCVAKKTTCKSFSFYPQGANGEHGNCKLYGNGGGYSTYQSDFLNYLFVTDPPTDPARKSDAERCATSCPKAHGQLYTSTGGEIFRMQCSKRHGTDYLKIDRRDTLEACMNACSVMPGCSSMEFEPRTKKCYYSNNQFAAAIDAPAFMSAHSLGSTSACSKCKKDCDTDGEEDPFSTDPPKSSSKKLTVDAPSCMNDHAKYTTANGEDFLIMCRQCLTNGNSYTSDAKSFNECAATCADASDCVGANWRKDSKDNSVKCWHQRNTGTNKLESDTACHALLAESRGIHHLADK